MKILARTEFTELKTGYAVYMKALLERLHSAGHEIAELASGVSADDPLVGLTKWRVYPNIPSKSNQEATAAYDGHPLAEFGAWQFEQVLLDFKPSVVIDISDVWHYEYQLRSPLRDYYAHIAMVPVDAEPQHRNWIDMYKKSDALIGYTQWGADLMKSNGCDNVVGVAMPFAPDVYQPMPNKKELQKELGLGDISIVGMVGRNQKRKLFLNLFKSFADLLQSTGRDDIYLYVHSSYPDRCYDFDKETIKYGIQNKVLYSYICRNCGVYETSLFKGAIAFCYNCSSNHQTVSNAQYGLSPEQMSRVYNLFDLYVQVSTNEGFCLPLMEAAACGIPCISTDYSSLSEVIRLVGGRPISPLAKTTEAETGRLFAVADDKRLTQAMEDFFYMPNNIMRVRGKATRNKYLQNWDIDKIMSTWDLAINSVKPKRLWTDEIQTRQAKLPPPNLSNVEFVRWLLVNVLHMPELVGTLMETRLIRDINDSYTTGGHGGEYFHEISATIMNSKYQEFNRELALGHFAMLLDKRNFWEQQRVDSIRKE